MQQLAPIVKRVSLSILIWFNAPPAALLSKLNPVAAVAAFICLRDENRDYEEAVHVSVG
jgi:hypothetical protein